MTNNIYPANGKFLKLQRALIALMCILVFASCNFKTKEYKGLINTDKEPIQNDSVKKKMTARPV